MADQMVLRPEECVVLDGKPCAACTEDMELEKELNELEIMIEKIHSRRRALRTTMNENHDPLIHKFPPEIASLVFMQSSPHSTPFERFYNPLYLGAVCQKWRRLAWATPELWTSLKLEYGYPVGGKYKVNLPQLMTEWLERSASLPLTIRLDDHWGWLNGPQLIDILNMHSARWHDMYIKVPVNLLDRFCGSSQGNLRRLVLCHPGMYGLNIPFSTFSMKSKARPTDLTLRTIGLPYVNITWDNLTVASVYDITVDDCLELIRRAPLLETLKLHAIKPSSDIFPIPNTRVVHSHLRSLTLLQIRNKTVVTGILDSFCFPSLKEWIHDRSHFPLGNMISFTGCLFSCLKTFKISIDKVDHHQLTELLSHLSPLESLELCAVKQPLTGDLIDLLCASSQSPLYLPYLKSLEFVCKFSFPWESLPQIFAPTSRWQSLRVRIKKVFRCPFREETTRLLLELIDNGFDLGVVGNGDVDLFQQHLAHMREVEGH